MGGIKNKLSKLTSKVKNLLSSLSLTERADERSSSGEVINNEVPLWLKGNVRRKSDKGIVLNNHSNKGSQPPSFSQPSKMPDGQISNTRKLSHLGLYASKPIGSLRPTSQSLPLSKKTTSKDSLSLKGAQDLLWDQRRQMKSNRISIGGFDRIVRITKYTSLACLTLAILSTLVLNIISSYSYSKINSNAEPVTQANSTLVSGPAEISLSISPITTPTSSQCDTSNSNICMSIPDDGGIATGGHTVSVENTSITGKSELSLTGSNSDWALKNSNNTSSVDIYPTEWTLSDAVTNDAAYPLEPNGWGLAMFMPSEPTFNQEFTQMFGDEQMFLDSTYEGTRWVNPSFLDNAGTTVTLSNYTLNFYYGVYVNDPTSFPAGDYSIDLTYTATAVLTEAPTISTLSQNSYELGSDTNLDSNNRLPVTITGTNLKSTYRVYLESNTDTSMRYDLTNNITSITDTQLKVILPTDITNSELEAGEYTIHVVTQGTDENGITIGFTYTEKQLPDGMLQSTTDYGSDGHVAVDYDENMIPITYTGNETTPKWVIADTSNTNSDTNLNWYDYPDKKWANAVTLTEEGLSLYKGQPVGTEIDEQYVLGYWVYIPRYAYKVMRKEVADKVVTDEVAKNNGKGGFEIVFETNDDIVKEPAICNNSNANQYYQDCIKNQYGEAGIDYPGNNEDLKDKTAWATHPAFTWQYTQDINGFDKTYELNGIWVGKFETTGNDNIQLVLPNKNYTNNNFNSKGIGHFFDLGKSLGVYDENNPYGNTEKISDTRQNNHNLSASYSHMAKNSEWGTVAYLSSSKYGSGIGKVLANASYSYTGRGSNEEKYQTSGGVKSSTTGTVYGVYDMSGGGDEVVAGGRTRSNFLPYTPKEEEYMMYLVRPPYINPYTFPSTNVTDPNKCSWESCGGHALHEIYNFQTITGQSSPTNIWGGNGESVEFFIGSSYPWFIRGGGLGLGATQGVYDVYMDSDKAYYADSFRAMLMAY